MTHTCYIEKSRGCGYFFNPPFGGFFLDQKWKSKKSDDLIIKLVKGGENYSTKL
jgi:hypothetical protein